MWLSLSQNSRQTCRSNSSHTECQYWRTDNNHTVAAAVGSTGLSGVLRQGQSHVTAQATLWTTRQWNIIDINISNHSQTASYSVISLRDHCHEKPPVLKDHSLGKSSIQCTKPVSKDHVCWEIFMTNRAVSGRFYCTCTTTAIPSCLDQKPWSFTGKATEHILQIFQYTQKKIA